MTETRVADALGQTTELVLGGGHLLAKGRSPFQAYEVWETPEFGRLYSLDGHFMASEADEFHGHESLVHVAAIAHPSPRCALVIGGGDGASVRELLRHPSMERVVVVELDAAVVDLGRRYLASVQQGVFDDPRVDLHIGDGFDHVTRTASAASASYDLIIFDLTGADGPAAALHEESFFRLCHGCLNHGGALVVQLGSPFYQRAQVGALMAALSRVFRTPRPYLVDIPLYGGAWAMACAADDLDPRALDAAEVERRLADRRMMNTLRHYNGELHCAQFALPNVLRTALLVDKPAAANLTAST